MFYQNLFPKLVKPGSQDDRLSPTLPEIPVKFALDPNCLDLLSFLVDFLHTPKLIKNRIPQNTTKNLKSRTPDRPKVDFWMTFGVHLGIDFHEILVFIINMC